MVCALGTRSALKGERSSQAAGRIFGGTEPGKEDVGVGAGVKVGGVVGVDWTAVGAVVEVAVGEMGVMEGVAMGEQEERMKDKG
jgi:hypothetical protein